MIQQELKERGLHARPRRRRTGRRKPERCAFAVINVGRRIHFRPGAQQQPSDLDNILRRLLAATLGTVVETQNPR